MDTPPVATPPVASAPTTHTPAAPTTETLTPGAWTAGFSEDLKGYTTHKGFKDPAQLAESYRNLEKLIGAPQERVMKLPERFYDDKGAFTPEGRAVYERLGAPKEAKEYGLDKLMPKEGGDKALMEHFSNVFHEAGIPKDAATKIVNSWNKYSEDFGSKMKEAATAKFKDSQQALQKDWGNAFEQNTRIAQDAVRTMGVTKEQIDAIASTLGHDQTMKLFHSFGTKVGEAPFIPGHRATEHTEPASARSQIKELMGDRDFGKKLMAGDADAKAKWDRLHKDATAGQNA